METKKSRRNLILAIFLIILFFIVISLIISAMIYYNTSSTLNETHPPEYYKYVEYKPNKNKNKKKGGSIVNEGIIKYPPKYSSSSSLSIEEKEKENDIKLTYINDNRDESTIVLISKIHDQKEKRSGKIKTYDCRGECSCVKDGEVYEEKDLFIEIDSNSESKATVLGREVFKEFCVIYYDEACTLSNTIEETRCEVNPNKIPGKKTTGVNYDYFNYDDIFAEDDQKSKENQKENENEKDHFSVSDSDYYDNKGNKKESFRIGEENEEKDIFNYDDESFTEDSENKKNLIEYECVSYCLENTEMKTVNQLNTYSQVMEIGDCKALELITVVNVYTCPSKDEKKSFECVEMAKDLVMESFDSFCKENSYFVNKGDQDVEYKASEDVDTEIADYFDENEVEEDIKNSRRRRRRIQEIEEVDDEEIGNFDNYYENNDELNDGLEEGEPEVFDPYHTLEERNPNGYGYYDNSDGDGYEGLDLFGDLEKLYDHKCVAESRLQPDRDNIKCTPW